MIKSIALTAIFLGALPFLLGLFYSRFTEEEKDNPLFHMAAGYVILFGLFEILALPMIFTHQSLSLLTSVYVGLLSAAAAVSLILNFRRLSSIVRSVFREVRYFTLCIWAQLLLILGQVLFYARYQYQNADDAFFVAASSTSLATDTLLAYHPYTGTAYAALPSRYALSPFYIFTAVVGKVTDTHPAIVAHTIFMIVFLLLAYAVYALLGQILFSHDMEKTGYFLLVLSALHIFSAYSERTAGLFLLIRLWQGKALLAGVLLPLVLYLTLRMHLPRGQKEDLDGEKKTRPADWLLLAAAMTACCMVSSMGIMLGAVMLGLLGILFAWRRRSVRLLVCMALCCLPNLICAGIYLLIR